MKYELSQRFHFDAAHTLQRKLDRESSARIHGHTYHAEVWVARPTGAMDQTGMVMDAGLLRSTLGAVRDQLDHRLLDEVPELGAPTLENLCAFIRDLAGRALFHESPVYVTRVRVWRESVGDSCTLE